MDDNMILQQDIIYQQTKIAQALIESFGMIAENMQRQVLGESMAYTYKDFDNLINKHGIHHNAVLSLLDHHR